MSLIILYSIMGIIAYTCLFALWYSQSKRKRHA